jgi:predicted ester cyclase
LMGIPPNGKSLRWIGTGVYRIANGKIAEQWGIDDAMGLMRQLGAIPSPA